LAPLVWDIGDSVPTLNKVDYSTRSAVSFNAFALNPAFLAIPTDSNQTSPTGHPDPLECVVVRVV
ncbi:MAG: hypothetical protein Q8L39_07630, partial [Burkholderiales bacterium]|nr:hypothetical protein [Burkholderiales bacterium]